MANRHQNHAEESRKTIEYFSHYVATESSLRIEQSLLSAQTLYRRVKALKAETPGDYDTSFVIKSAVCLLKNRFLLRGIYAFRHFLFSSADSEFSRGTLGRELEARGLMSLKTIAGIETSFSILHKKLSQTTERLANLAGRTTFKVPRSLVIEATDMAESARRKLKNYLRQSRLSDMLRARAVSSAEVPANDDSRRRIFKNYPVRGLQASLRQLSDGSTQTSDFAGGLRTPSACSDEGGRLFEQATRTVPVSSSSNAVGSPLRVPSNEYWQWADQHQLTTWECQRLGGMGMKRARSAAARSTARKLAEGRLAAVRSVAERAAVRSASGRLAAARRAKEDAGAKEDERAEPPSYQWTRRERKLHQQLASSIPMAMSEANPLRIGEFVVRAAEADPLELLQVTGFKTKSKPNTESRRQAVLLRCQRGHYGTVLRELECEEADLRRADPARVWKIRENWMRNKAAADDGDDDKLSEIRI